MIGGEAVVPLTSYSQRVARTKELTRWSMWCTNGVGGGEEDG